MPGWMVCLGGRMMSAEQVGFTESETKPYLDVFRLTRLYGGHVTLGNGRATIHRAGLSRTIEPMRHVNQRPVASVDVIARALDVPYAIRMEDRIIRLGRNEKALDGTRIHIGSSAPESSLPWHDMAEKEASTSIALRVVDWLTLHRAAATLVECNVNGQDHSDGAGIAVGIRYVFEQGNGPWSVAYYQGRYGEKLATHLQREIVLATGRKGRSIRVVRTDKRNPSVSCGGAAFLVVTCANPRFTVDPWWHESEAATIYCGVRHFLDQHYPI